MSGQRQRAKFEQLMELERGRNTGVHEEGFSNYTTAAHVQQNSSIAIRTWNRWVGENQPTRTSRSERQKMTSMRDDRHLVRMALIKSTTSSRKLAAHWSTDSGVFLSASSIRPRFLFPEMYA